MIRYYVMRDEGKDKEREWFCYGTHCSRVRWKDMDEDWVRENGYKTRPAAVQAAGGHWVLNNDKTIRIASLDVEETGLRYKIYKCYEIVILNSDGSQVWESNYCYGSKADAEDMAKRELKLAMMEKEGR